MAFEDLDVWKRSCRLSVELYRELEGLKNWGFRDQITRSGLSVPSNIAEGFERDSDAEIIRDLFRVIDWTAKPKPGTCDSIRH